MTYRRCRSGVAHRLKVLAGILLPLAMLGACGTASDRALTIAVSLDIPQVTRFKVGFADAAVRDAFNAGLNALCQSGAYRQLLQQYQVPEVAGVCAAAVR